MLHPVVFTCLAVLAEELDVAFQCLKALATQNLAICGGGHAETRHDHGILSRRRRPKGKRAGCELKQIQSFRPFSVKANLT